MEIDPGDILKEAREAFADKKYSLSLEKYKWFFENALKIKRSYYGVRLSYCLCEWADLGGVYPQALDELRILKESKLRVFKKTNSHCVFHEYESICGALGCPDEPVEIFQEIAPEDKALAERIFTYVYAEFARQSKWEICREYIGNGYNQYKEILELFDACIKGARRKGDEQGEGILKTSVNKTIEELLWILEMQAHVNAIDEVDSTIERIKHDFAKRGYTEVYEQVLRRAPNKTLQRTSR
ncbi:MAG: hypothetical protein JAY90_11380 [Candidatus Thiodiazotropha lotti]|nr:hypothetical protein [Candidatus Thiodiazotropha lotti]